MFPHPLRLHTTQDILYVLRKGERRVVGCVSCHFVAKPGTVGKVTVIVDTKTARLATDRNLLKRRIRAALKKRGLPSGLLVVRLLKGAPKLSFAELQHYLSQCLDRLNTTRSNDSR